MVEGSVVVVDDEGVVGCCSNTQPQLTMMAAIADTDDYTNVAAGAADGWKRKRMRRRLHDEAIVPPQITHYGRPEP